MSTAGQVGDHLSTHDIPAPRGGQGQRLDALSGSEHEQGRRTSSATGSSYDRPSLSPSPRPSPGGRGRIIVSRLAFRTRPIRRETGYNPPSPPGRGPG